MVGLSGEGKSEVKWAQGRQIADSGKAALEGLVPHIMPPLLRLMARSTARTFSQQPSSRLKGGLSGGYCEIQRQAG